MNTPPFLSVNSSCDKAVQWAKKQLLQADLRAVQTFDLHTARVGLQDCSCTNHGTNKCDCQMVILLVYGKTAEPVTLILHGNGGQTWFSIADNLLYEEHTQLVTIIQRALEIKTPILVSQDI